MLIWVSIYTLNSISHFLEYSILFQSKTAPIAKRPSDVNETKKELGKITVLNGLFVCIILNIMIPVRSPGVVHKPL